MSNNHIRRISVSSTKDTLVVKTFGMSCGGWAVITYFDTIVKLGLLPNGNYILCVISCLDTNTADSSCYINHRFYYMDTVMANFLVLGIEEPIVKPAIEVIPNPFGVAAEIILDRTYRDVKIDVVDGCGRIIRSKTHNNRQSIEFRRGTLKNGIYYLRILLDEEAVLTKKILITR